MKKRNVGILVFDYVDILDFAGPAEVLALTANSKAEQTLTLYKKRLLPTRPFEVFLISDEGTPIKTHSGITVHPDFSLDDHPELDILLVPGGPLRAVQATAKHARIKEWIAMHKNIEYICSICTGAYILGATGLLDGRMSTTHHLASKSLQEKYPKTRIQHGRKVVHDGNIITSGGVSSGIHMALYLVGQILGGTASNRTAKAIEFSLTEQTTNGK